MPINVSGPGNRQGNPDGGPRNTSTNPLTQAVLNLNGRNDGFTGGGWAAPGRTVTPPPGSRTSTDPQGGGGGGVPAAGSFGTVGGEQYPSAGAAGITKYGLFGGAPSSSSSGQPPPMQVPGAQPSTTPPAPAPQGVRAQPRVSIANPSMSGARVPSPMGGSATGFNAAPAASSPMTPSARMPGQLSMQQRIAQARPLINRSTPPGAAPPQGTMTVAAAGAPPPAPSGQMQGFSTGGQGQQQSGLQQTDTGAMTNGPPTEDYTSAGGVAKAAGDAVQNAASGAASDAGGAFGQTLASAINGYNNGMGQQSDPSFSDFFSKMAPGFQDSSLTNAVGQNMQQMMDPAAWQQMAQNQLDARTAANTSSLNLAQRRLADSAGRSGLANAGGADADLLRNFANEQAGAQRDVYNDTLDKQMNAANMAGSYANGLRGQDVSMKNSLDALAGQGASQDLANAREDNPSFIKVLQSLMGGAGAAAGAGGQAAGGLLSLLPLLAAA